MDETDAEAETKQPTVQKNCTSSFHRDESCDYSRRCGCTRVRAYRRFKRTHFLSFYHEEEGSVLAVS